MRYFVFVSSSSKLFGVISSSGGTFTPLKVVAFLEFIASLSRLCALVTAAIPANNAKDDSLMVGYQTPSGSVSKTGWPVNRNGGEDREVLFEAIWREYRTREDMSPGECRRGIRVYGNEGLSGSTGRDAKVDKRGSRGRRRSRGPAASSIPWQGFRCQSTRLRSWRITSAPGRIRREE